MPIDPSMFGIGQQGQQDPSAQQGQAGINFGLIAPQQQKSGVVAQLPQAQGAGDGGIVELLGGLKSLVGLVGHKAPVDAQSANTGVNPSYNPQNQYDSLNKAVTPTLTPDLKSPFGVQRDPSNFAHGGTTTPQQIIFHDTAGPSYKSAVDTLHERGLSYNYIIDTNGAIHNLVPPGTKAFHAKGYNDNTIGVSFVGGGGFGNTTPAQQKAATQLAIQLKQQFPTINGFAGHRDRTHAGKPDPEGFDYTGFQQATGLKFTSGPGSGRYKYDTSPGNNTEVVPHTGAPMANNNPYSPESIVSAAKAAYPNNPTMAKLAASQAFLESGLASGKPSGLAQKNNLFGIKGVGTDGTAVMPTTEYINGRPVKIKAGFAANKSIDDSFKQHSDLMNHPRYQGVSQAKTLQDAAQAVQKAGYATDPNYSKEIQRVYDQNLSKYFDESKAGPQAMNSRALPGTGQVPIRELHPEDIQAIMNNQAAQAPQQVG